jgi:hypothetical protein
MNINNWTSTERFECKKEAERVLQKVKSSRKNKKFRLVKIGEKTFIEKEIK